MGRTHLFGLALAAATVTASGGQDADLARQLRSAGKSFADATAKQDLGGVHSTLADVVGVAAATAARGGAPPGVAARLGTAQAALRAGNSPSPDAARDLGEAYSALQGGRAFSIPADVKTFDQVLEACRREIDSAAAALESGRREDALRGMITFALLVTTPIAAN